MRIFFGVMLVAGALFLFSCSSSDNQPTPTPTPTPQTLTWDAEKPTWDNAKWN